MADSHYQASLRGTVELWPQSPPGGFRRVLLKLSGEAFAGNGGLGVDPGVVDSIASQLMWLAAVWK